MSTKQANFLVGSPVITPEPTRIDPQTLQDLLDILYNNSLSRETTSTLFGPECLFAIDQGDPASAQWYAQKTIESYGSTESIPSSVIAAALFYAHLPLAHSLVERLIPKSLLVTLISHGLLIKIGGTESAQEYDDFVIPSIDIKEVTVQGSDPSDSFSFLLASDLDASLEKRVPGKDHVLGAGAATHSLINMIPTKPVGSVLDMGCGSGSLLLSQALHMAAIDTSDPITLLGTDIHGRALEYAQANISAWIAHKDATDIKYTLSHGSWFEPVLDKKFERIIANPPFVVGQGTVEHIYRDSEFELDGATEFVVNHSAEHLSHGGTAHILGAWITTAEESGHARVARWIPDRGITAWVLKRETVDPATYVRTWLRDESLDPQSAEGMYKTAHMLDYFAQHDVKSISLGFIHLQKTEENSEITAESLSQGTLSYFGNEVLDYFSRSHWLSQQSQESLLGSRFQIAPGVVLEELSMPDADTNQGFAPLLTRISRADLHSFSHDIDEHVHAIISGLNPYGLNLEDTIDLYATVHQLDSSAVVQEMIPIITDLIRHGLIVPHELAADHA